MLVTKKNFKKVIQKLSGRSRYVVDLETTGLRPYHGDRLCGVAIKSGKEAYYLPFRHGDGTNLPLSYLERLRPILERPGAVYVGANYKFDLQMLWVDEIEHKGPIKDVQLAAHLMNENEPTFKLKPLAAKLISEKYGESEQELIDLIIERGYASGKIDAKGFMWMLRPEEVERYACDDVRMTDELDQFFDYHLEQWRLTDLYKEVCQYQVITAKMERRGLKIDTKRTKKYIKEANKKVGPSKAILDELAGYDINPNSPKQLQAAMGVSTTKAEVLLDIIESEHAPKKQKRFAKAILEHRGWAKVNNTYYEVYLRDIDENKILHPNLSLTGTIAGRLSCYSPNLQAVPRYTEVYKVKDVFIARSGYVLVSCDYSQAEMRLASHYGRIIINERLESIKHQLHHLRKKLKSEGLSPTEQKLWRKLKEEKKRYQIPWEETMDWILTNGLDMHGETAKLLDIPRDSAKRINLSIIYGIGSRTLSERLRCDQSVAAEFLRRYHKSFPGLRLLYRAAEMMAIDMGVIQMWTGRLRHYNCTRALTRKASSNLIQGGIAEIMRVAILRLDALLSKLDSHMLLQVHDQIIFEVPEAELRRIVPKIINVMEGFDEFHVPMMVDVKAGKRWGTMKKWDKNRNDYEQEKLAA